MSDFIDVKIDGVEAAKKALADFPNRVPGVVSSAINRSLTNVGSNIRKEVRANYEIKARDVSATLKRSNSTRSTLSGSIKSTGRPIPLDRFKVSPKTVQPKRKRQLNITIKKGSVKQITGAFVANIHGIKIFTRTGKFGVASKGSYEGTRREGIERKFSLSVPQMIGSKSVSKTIEVRGQQMFRRRLTHGVNQIMKGYGR